MRNIVLILLSFLLVLSGCSDTSYSEEDLINGGYVVNETDNIAYRSWDNSDVFVSFDDNDNIEAIGVNELSSSYQSVQLKYVYMDSKWIANFFIGNRMEEINPNDAYAYMEGVAPEAINDMLKLVDSENITTRALEDGDSTVVEDLLAINIIISEPVITDATYTSDDALNAVNYTQANFDLTNNTGANINLGDTYFSLCFNTLDTDECVDLEVVEPSDTKLENEILKSDDTLSVQLKAIVPTDASNFYVSFGIPSNEIYVDSVVVEKLN